MANPLDRLIGWLSPEAGARRMAWRARMEIVGMQQRRYAAARRDHRTESWDAKGWSARAEVAWDAKIVRDRVRSLMRDNGYMAKALNSLVDYTVGAGILGTPRGGSGWTSAKLRALFDECVDTIDYYGEQDLYGLQNQAFRSFAESGDVFLRLHRTGRGRIPLAVQLLEIDHLDTSKSGKTGDGFIDRGIEYDAMGRKTAFHLFEVHPGDRSRFSPLSLKSVRVPVDQVIHLFDPLRPGQDRGVSLFAPAVMPARDLQEYFVAEDTRKRIEACLAGFVTSEEGVEGTGIGADGKQVETADGKLVESFVPGMIARLRPGEDIEIAQPASSGGIAEYAEIRLREIAAAPGVMYEMITGDYSNVNYSSWRAGHHTFQRRVEFYQWLRVIPMICRRIGTAFRDATVSAQLAPTAEFSVGWTPPGFVSVNPHQDAKADELDLLLGKVSPSELVERRGENFEEHLDRIERDRKAAESRGLKFAWEPQRKAPANGKDSKVTSETETAPFVTRSAIDVVEHPAALDRNALEVIYRELEIRGDTLAVSEDESEFTIDVVWTTGMRGVRFDWERWDYIEEELSTDKKHVRLDRLNAGAPVLNAHSSRNLKDIIGVVVEGSARMEKGQGVATLRIVSTPDIADIVTKIRAGVIKNISVGYTVHQYDITEKQGQRPLYRAVDWEPYEISFVPMPFDWKAQARNADATQGGVPCIFRRSAPPIVNQERKMDEDENAGGGQQPETVVTPPVQQQRQAPPAPQTPPADQVTAVDLDKFVRDAGLPADFALEMIRENATTPMTRATALEKVLAKRAAQDARPINGRHSGQITITQDQRDKTIRGIENAIILRAGLGDMLSGAAKLSAFQHRHGLSGERYDLDAGEFRGLRMVNLARMALERGGAQIRTYDENEIVAQALVRRDTHYNSTGDFAVALESVMHKTLQAAYLTQPDAWTKFCGIGSVTDFRLHNRYLRGSFGRLDPVNEHGEFKNKSIPDAAKETIKASRFGNIVGLTREAIVNDDLGLFDSILPDLGRAAKISIEVDVFALLTSNSGVGPNMNDGNPMIHSSHANIGTSAAPTTDSFDEARQIMAKQKDISGNEFLDIRPAIWLGSLAKGGTARVLNDAQYDPDTANKLQRPNMVRGLFREIVDTPRLTGNPWWAFADPAQAPAIEVVFLNGEQMPQLDTKDGWRIDGYEARAKHEYGVGAVNWRSVVRNAGG